MNDVLKVLFVTNYYRMIHNSQAVVSNHVVRSGVYQQQRMTLFTKTYDVTNLEK